MYVSGMPSKKFGIKTHQRALLVHSETEYAELASMRCFLANMFRGAVVKTKFSRLRQTP